MAPNGLDQAVLADDFPDFLGPLDEDDCKIERQLLEDEAS